MKKILVVVLVACFMAPSLTYAATTDEIRLQLIQLIIQEIAMLEAELASEGATPSVAATSTPVAQAAQFGAITPSATATVLETGAGGISIDVTGDFDSASVQVKRPDGTDFIHGGFNPAKGGVYHYELDHVAMSEDANGKESKILGDYQWIVTTRKNVEGGNPIDTQHTGTLTVQ